MNINKLLETKKQIMEKVSLCVGVFSNVSETSRFQNINENFLDCEHF